MKKITEVRAKLEHIFNKNVLTKLKRYATMVATSGNRDVRTQGFCASSAIFKGGKKIVN